MQSISLDGFRIFICDELNREDILLIHPFEGMLLEICFAERTLSSTLGMILFSLRSQISFLSM